MMVTVQDSDNPFSPVQHLSRRQPRRARGRKSIDSSNVSISGSPDRDHSYCTGCAFEIVGGCQYSLQILDLHDRQGMLRKNNGTGKQFKMPPKVPGRPAVYAVNREVFGDSQ